MVMVVEAMDVIFCIATMPQYLTIKCDTLAHQSVPSAGLGDFFLLQKFSAIWYEYNAAWGLGMRLQAALVCKQWTGLDYWITGLDYCTDL